MSSPVLDDNNTQQHIQIVALSPAPVASTASALLTLKESLASLTTDNQSMFCRTNPILRPVHQYSRLHDLCNALSVLVQGNHFLARSEPEELTGNENAGLEELEVVDHFQFQADRITPHILRDILLNVKRLLIKGYIAPKYFLTAVTLLRVVNCLTQASMARVVVGETPEEMRFGDFLEEFIFMVFRIEKLLRRVDYFQEPDEILIQDTARMEPDQQQEVENEEQQEERGYEICTVMEDSNEDENEESGSSSRRNQKRSNQKSPMLTDTNQLMSAALGNEMLAANFHGRSSFDATQSQDSQSEQHRSLGEVTTEREGNKGYVGIMTPEKRISLKGGPTLYPNIPQSHIEEGGLRSLSASSQKRGGHSNVNDLLNSLRKSTEVVSPAYRYQAIYNQTSASVDSREVSPNRREADHFIEEMVSQTPKGHADSNLTHRKDKISARR